jgi:hypothetical protein
LAIVFFENPKACIGETIGKRCNFLENFYLKRWHE